MMKDDRDDGDSEDDEAPYEEEEDWDRVQSLDGRTLDAVDLDKSIHARPEEVIADGDCFDDLDGRHGMHENDSARERRLRGESGFIDQLTSFETRSVFYSSLFIFEWLIFLFFPPLFVAFTVCVAAPLVGIYFWWRLNQKECTLSSVVHAVGRGFYDVTLLMVAASYGVLLFALIVMYWIYDSGGFKGASERTVTFCFYVFVLLPFVTSEEALKAMFVRLQQKRLGVDSGPDAITRSFVIHSTCTSCGYALSQAMGWVTITHVLLMYHSGDLQSDDDGAGTGAGIWGGGGSYASYKDDVGRQCGLMLLVGLSVTLFGTPLQLLSGYLIGLEVTRKSFHRWFGLPLVVPTLLRSLYYVASVGWLLIVDHVAGGLALAGLTNALVMAAMVLRVKDVEKRMPPSYLRRVGYLHIAGYGILEIEDNQNEDEDEDGGRSGGGGDVEMGNRRRAKAATTSPKKIGGANPGRIGEEDDDIQRDRKPLTPFQERNSVEAGAAAAAAKKTTTQQPKPAAASRDSVLARFAAMRSTKPASASAGAASNGATTNPLAKAATEEERKEKAFSKFDDLDEEII